MPRYRLTVRHGSTVSRESFDRLDEAVEAMQARAEAVRAEGPLEGVTMLREFDPDVRVAARLELSTGSWLRGRDVGVDVMGDGSLIPYQGGIRRRKLEALPGEWAFETVRRELGI
jgi:hypothetical protein